MAEYIERDEAIRKALEACVKVVGHGIPQMDAVDIVDVMESIPTEDVVPVVRCAECSSYEIVEYYHPTDPNPTKRVCRLLQRQVQPDDYCSYGERRCDDEQTEGNPH